MPRQRSLTRAGATASSSANAKNRDEAALLGPVLPRAKWPKIEFGVKRAITLAEHRMICQREPNPERRAFYEVLWQTGASQTDAAMIRAEGIEWGHKVLAYSRRKTGTPAVIRIGPDLEAVLRSLPATGPLFPYLRTVRCCDRATEFRQRCAGLGIRGVTLHSYRYSWAQRAKALGYPERWAQQALGHSSKAVHRAYADGGEIELPSLDAREEQRRGKVIPLPRTSEREAAEGVTGPETMNVVSARG